MEATVTIHKIEVKPSNFGIHNFKAPKYARTHTTEQGICLYVEGVDSNGKLVHFWTPQVVIATTTGMLHYKRLRSNVGGFFQTIEGESVGHQSPFKGDTVMPVVIECKDEIVPVIEVNQTYTVSFRSEEQKFGQRRLKVVRFISK